VGINRTMTSAFPSLPDLPGDAVLEIFTHPSLNADSDYARYLAVGEAQCKASIAYILFFLRPPLTQAEIVEKHQVWLNDGFVLDCVKAYKLDKRLRLLPTLKEEVLASTVEMRNLFYAYMGGILIHKGLQVFQEFIKNLIHHADNSVPLDIPDATPAVKVKSEPAESGLPQSSGKPNVQRLNEIASQNRLKIEYETSSTGPSHAPTWTFRILINGQEKGRASSNDKRGAKDLAAGQALQNLQG